MILALSLSKMLCPANMFLANIALVPRVAELPTSKWLLSVGFPFKTFTTDPLAVLRPLPSWKTNA